MLDPANTNRDILADKGYVDGEREARLTKQGWPIQIQRKGNKGKPISETQKRRNTRIAKTRARDATAQLESRRLQFAASGLLEGGQDRGVLTPAVRPDCRKRCW